MRIFLRVVDSIKGVASGLELSPPLPMLLLGFIRFYSSELWTLV